MAVGLKLHILSLGGDVATEAAAEIVPPVYVAFHPLTGGYCSAGVIGHSAALTGHSAEVTGHSAAVTG